MRRGRLCAAAGEGIRWDVERVLDAPEQVGRWRGHATQPAAQRADRHVEALGQVELREVETKKLDAQLRHRARCDPGSFRHRKNDGALATP
jgi:hypothetical protein